MKFYRKISKGGEIWLTQSAVTNKKSLCKWFREHDKLENIKKKFDCCVGYFTSFCAFSFKCKVLNFIAFKNNFARPSIRGLQKHLSEVTKF